MAGPSELRRFRGWLALVGILAFFGGLALIGVLARDQADENGGQEDTSLSKEAPPEPEGESALVEPEPDSGEPEPGPGPAAGTGEESVPWDEAGIELDLVLAIGKGQDGYELVDLADGAVFSSTLPVVPELMYETFLVGTSGIGEARRLVGPGGIELGLLPTEANLLRHTDPTGPIWTFERFGLVRNRHFVFEMREIGEPETVISATQTPSRMLPILNSDGPRFVAGDKGGVYELIGDLEVSLVATGLPISAIGGTVATWSCDEVVRCAVVVASSPDWEPMVLTSTYGLAGHDADWFVSSDGQWVIYRDLVESTTIAINLETGMLVPVPTLGSVAVGADYGFWVQDGRVEFMGLLDGRRGYLEVSGRSRVSGLALGPRQVLDGY